MPLSSTRLASAIRSALVQRNWILDGQDLTDLCADIATAVVVEVVANAVVAVPATGIVAPAGGGPCTGAAVGTVS